MPLAEIAPRADIAEYTCKGHLWVSFTEYCINEMLLQPNRPTVPARMGAEDVGKRLAATLKLAKSSQQPKAESKLPWGLL